MAVTLDRFEAETLGVKPGSPAIVLTRTVFDADDEIVEVARDVYRGDRTEFSVTAPVEASTVAADDVRNTLPVRRRPHRPQKSRTPCLRSAAWTSRDVHPAGGRPAP